MPRLKPTPPAPVVPIGTAFGVPLDGDRWALCRVIGLAPAAATSKIFLRGAVASRAVLVLATRWTGTRAQLASAIADPQALQPLRLTHHSWRDKPYVITVHTPPPPTFVPLGALAPTDGDRKLRNVYFAWESLATQYRAQLAWEADAEAVRAADRARARATRQEVVVPTRRAPPGKPRSLAQLARRKPFATWREPLRTRARTRIVTLIDTLADKPVLQAIARCARSFNRERDLGTLEAEELDEVLLALACAIGVDADTYGRAIDAVRDW